MTHGRVVLRDVGQGAAAAVAALTAMATVAAAEPLLLDAVRFSELPVLTAVVPVLAAGLGAASWLVAAVGPADGAVVGFASSLSTSGMRSMASVGWRTWTDRIRR